MHTYLFDGKRICWQDYISPTLNWNPDYVLILCEELEGFNIMSINIIFHIYIYILNSNRFCCICRIVENIYMVCKSVNLNSHLSSSKIKRTTLLFTFCFLEPPTHELLSYMSDVYDFSLMRKWDQHVDARYVCSIYELKWFEKFKNEKGCFGLKILSKRTT